MIIYMKAVFSSNILLISCRRLNNLIVKDFELLLIVKNYSKFHLVRIAKALLKIVNLRLEYLGFYTDNSAC